MLRPEQVPGDVAYAAEAAWANEATWQEIIAAALNAWPGALHRIGIKRHKNGEWRQPYPMICLPLPQENTDNA